MQLLAINILLNRGIFFAELAVEAAEAAEFNFSSVTWMEKNFWRRASPAPL